MMYISLPLCPSRCFPPFLVFHLWDGLWNFPRLCHPNKCLTFAELLSTLRAGLGLPRASPPKYREILLCLSPLSRPQCRSYQKVTSWGQGAMSATQLFWVPPCSSDPGSPSVKGPPPPPPGTAENLGGPFAFFATSPQPVCHRVLWIPPTSSSLHALGLALTPRPATARIFEHVPRYRAGR